MKNQYNINAETINDHLNNLLEEQNAHLLDLEKSNTLLINRLKSKNIENLSKILIKRERIEKHITKLDDRINNYFHKKIKKNTGILNNNNLTLIKLIQDKSLTIGKSFHIIIEMIKKYQSALEQNLNSLRRETMVVESYTSFNKGHTQYELKG